MRGLERGRRLPLTWTKLSVRALLRPYDSWKQEALRRWWVALALPGRSEYLRSVRRSSSRLKGALDGIRHVARGPCIRRPPVIPFERLEQSDIPVPKRRRTE